VQPEPVGVSAPPAREHLNQDAEAVDAGGRLHGVRFQLPQPEVGDLLGQLPQQRVLKTAVFVAAAAAEKVERPRLPDAGLVVAQMEQVPALAVVDERGGVHRLRLPVQPRLEKLLAQRRRGDLRQRNPPGARHLLVLQGDRRRLLTGEIEHVAEVVVLVGLFALRGVGVDVVNVDIDW
jgi:hypothetical protein